MSTFEPAPALLAEIAPLAQRYRAADAVQDAMQRASARSAYHDALSRAQALGWAGALGESHELPDAQMPAGYLERRTLILDQLENELGRLAMEYRSAITSQQMGAAIAAYRAVFDEMVRIGHWHGAPDLDSQLPLDDMPASFKEQRNERIRRFRARQAAP